MIKKLLCGLSNKYNGAEMNHLIENQIIESIQAKKALLDKNYISQIEEISKVLIDVYQNKGKVLLCGNGGSASDAQHIAGELVGRFKIERRGLPALALSANSAVITAIANDYGYENIFSRQIEAHGESKDCLIAISTSGNSENIISAVQEAKLLGLKTIGLLGKSGGKLKDIVDIAMIIPSDDTPRIQECHILIGHILCDIVEKALGGNKV
jgi:D-sedoheptulose 7-phosphate isomerase